MGGVFEWLSEFWLRFTEKINGVVFSFILYKFTTS